jgi:hypothetical protein
MHNDNDPIPPAVHNPPTSYSAGSERLHQLRPQPKIASIENRAPHQSITMVDWTKPSSPLLFHHHFGPRLPKLGGNLLDPFEGHHKDDEQS